MKRIVVVSGGSLDVGQYKALYSEHNEDTYVIGVDGGALWLINHQFDLDLAVGDFDTIGSIGLQRLEQLRIPTRSFVAEKDETDTELAVRIAIEKRPEKIVIYGGLGSRFDHSFANVHLLWKCADAGVACEVVNPWNRIYLINETYQLSSCFPFISLIPFSPIVEGVTLKGFKYPLTDATLKWGDTIGISNELVDCFGEIRVKSGWLLVIESTD